ncbi:MAG: integration host factor subunit alpha [Desulfamplus sp.]|nr:integration host factor subunit alpha [Desulfamplus sp.]
MALTKIEIVEEIRQKTLLSPYAARNAVEALLEIMKTTLASGDDLLISGLGKFCVRNKAARKGRNPATKQTMTLPSRRVVTFKCSLKLKDRVNNG